MYNDKRPIYDMPLSQEQFNDRYLANQQIWMLNDVQELKEQARHNRNMERDGYKSMLRKEEYAARARSKVASYKFDLINDQLVMTPLNINNEEIAKGHPVFIVHIQNLKKFVRDGTDKEYWRVFGRTADGIEYKSALYSAEILCSTTKLQHTELSRFTVPVAPNLRKLVWDKIASVLREKYKSAEEIKLPNKPGWHGADGKYHFWSAADDPVLLTDGMKRFRFDLSADEKLSLDNILSVLLQELWENFEYGGMMLIIRMEGLLGGLLPESVPCQKVVMFGRNAESLAKLYFRVMSNSSDVVNIGGDRIEKVRERVKMLGGNPVFFILPNQDGREVKRHIKIVESWAGSGLVEGERTVAPYVFCGDGLSRLFPCDEALVIDADKIKNPKDGTVFSKLQAYMIKKIETSGNYLVDKLNGIYEAKLAEGKIKLIAWASAVVELMRIILLDDSKSAFCTKILYVLEHGLGQIESQLGRGTGGLIEIFREAVIDLVENGEISVANSMCVPDNIDINTIYYDGAFYYFPKETMKNICDKAKINQGSILSIKQQMIEQGEVKLYKYAEKTHRELSVDFRITFESGKKKELSGFAIKKTFWDKLGGIALYERVGIK